MKKETDKLRELNNAFKQNYDEMSAKYNDLETDKSRFEKKISCLENELELKAKEKNTIAKTCEEVLTKAERVAAEKKELEKTKVELVKEKDQLETQYEELNKKVLYLFRGILVNIHLFKVNNRNTRKRCEMCSKLTIKTPERRQWLRCGVFVVNFEYISYLFLVLSGTSKCLLWLFS